MEGYKNLSSFILATVVYDLTVEFCKIFIDPKSRTKDQMEQSARSGKQNIAEGYTFESLSSYIYLAGVARGSIKELSEDYEDFLRQRGLEIYQADHEKVRVFRDFRARWISPNYPNSPKLPEDPEAAANMLLTFCNMLSFLLRKQIESLEAKFIREGGFRENLHRKRLEQKQN